MVNFICVTCDTGAVYIAIDKIEAVSATVNGSTDSVIQLSSYHYYIVKESVLEIIGLIAAASYSR